MTTETSSPRRYTFGLGWLLRRNAASPPPDANGVEKIGAGLLVRDAETGDCLLLLRRSVHNDSTWGLPGGNADPEDGALPEPHTLGSDCAADTRAAGGDLRRTALREATEEMGALPQMRPVGVHLTTRGKVRALRGGLPRCPAPPLSAHPKRGARSGIRSSSASSCTTSAPRRARPGHRR